MSRIRERNTTPEVQLRRMLHAARLRFRLNAPRLPGRPDIVLPGLRTVIFVHGCFWHRHKGCANCTTPTANRAFWLEKFRGNEARDRRNQRRLRRLGWSVWVVWECDVEQAAGSVKRALGALRRRVAELQDQFRQ